MSIIYRDFESWSFAHLPKGEFVLIGNDFWQVTDNKGKAEGEKCLNKQEAIERFEYAYYYMAPIEKIGSCKLYVSKSREACSMVEQLASKVWKVKNNFYTSRLAAELAVFKVLNPEPSFPFKELLDDWSWPIALRDFLLDCPTIIGDRYYFDMYDYVEIISTDNHYRWSYRGIQGRISEFSAIEAYRQFVSHLYGLVYHRNRDGSYSFHKNGINARVSWLGGGWFLNQLFCSSSLNIAFIMAQRKLGIEPSVDKVIS